MKMTLNWFLNYIRFFLSFSFLFLIGLAAITILGYGDNVIYHLLIGLGAYCLIGENSHAKH